MDKSFEELSATGMMYAYNDESPYEGDIDTLIPHNPSSRGMIPIRLRPPVDHTEINPLAVRHVLVLPRQNIPLGVCGTSVRCSPGRRTLYTHTHTHTHKPPCCVSRVNVMCSGVYNVPRLFSFFLYTNNSIRKYFVSPPILLIFVYCNLLHDPSS